MSTPPLPPPPPSLPPQPPSGFGQGAPPPGYVPYAAVPKGHVLPSKGLSKAMIALYWLTTAAAAGLAFAFFQRKGTFDDFIDNKASLADIDDADSFVGAIAVLVVLLVLVSAILTCLWAKRIANNAQARGVGNVQPGLAAGGWFIPIGWFWVGFKELRKSGQGLNVNVSKLALWQGLFIAQSVASFVARNFGDFKVTDSASEVSSALQNQWVVGLISAVLFAAATVFAMGAAKQLDDGVTGA